MVRKLFQVLVLLAVIVILASIVVATSRRDNESAVRMSLNRIRRAVWIYERVHDRHPDDLAQVASEEFPEEAGGGHLLVSQFFAPKLPLNRVTRGNVEGIDWFYDQETGKVWAKPGTARDGTDYSTW